MRLSYLLLLLAAVSAFLCYINWKFGFEYLCPMCVICALFFFSAGIIKLPVDKEEERYLEYEKTLDTFEYEAVLSDERIIPAKTCETKNEFKVCEVLEYSYYNKKGKKDKEIRVIVEDYWKK